MKHQINLAAIVAMALGSCITYKEAPVDLAHDTAEWAAISSAVCKGNRLSKEQMLQTGLLLNRELNQARLKAAKSTSVAEFSGLWADPTVSFEIERVFGENITNSALAPGLTLPVTGLPALAKKIAEQYKEADYWRMKVAEQNYMTELECLRHRIMVTHEKLRVIQARLSVASAEHKQIARLHQLGEIDFGAFQVAAQRLNDTEEAEKELDIEHTRLRHELIEKLGLHPIVGVIELSGALPESVPGKVSVPTADALLKSPSLMVLQAEYGASENELRAEIRKQYPELGISPGYARDDGNDEFSIGVSIPLSIWNRNREAIARADGDRAIKQAELISEWRNLLQQSAFINAEQIILRQHCADEYEELSALDAAAAKQMQLFELGETKIQELAEARHVAFERRLQYLDCLENLLITRCKLQYLNPDFNKQ